MKLLNYHIYISYCHYLELFNATNIITNYNYKTNKIIAFIVLYEYTLLKIFKPYKISETSSKV